MDRNFTIDVRVDWPEERAAGIPDDAYIANLSATFHISLGGFNYKSENEPLAYFLRELYCASINSIMFELDSYVSFFANDVTLRMRSPRHTSSVMEVGLYFSDQNLVSSSVSTMHLSRCLKQLIFQVVVALKSRVPFDVMTAAFLAPMIPLNEAYLDEFFGRPV